MIAYIIGNSRIPHTLEYGVAEWPVRLSIYVCIITHESCSPLHAKIICNFYFLALASYMFDLNTLFALKCIDLFAG